MRRYLIVAAVVALAACGSNETPVEGDAVRDSGLGTALAANDPAAAHMAGTYEVISEDGTAVMQTIEADGTYTETIDGTETERGTWHLKGDQMCYDPEGDIVEQCYTGGTLGNDGSFSVEMDDGTASVRRVDTPETAEPAAAGVNTQ